MILELVESDTPKTMSQKVAEYAARPPIPILRFYKEPKRTGDYLEFSVRNGTIVPLLYNVAVEIRYDNTVDYIQVADHIGPFSEDKWRLRFTQSEPGPGQCTITTGLLPFEFQTDVRRVALDAN